MKSFRRYFIEQMANKQSLYGNNYSQHKYSSSSSQQNKTANDLRKQAEQQRKQAYGNSRIGNTQAAQNLNNKANITSQAERQQRQATHQKRIKSVTTLSKSKIKPMNNIRTAMKQKNSMLKYQGR